MSMIFEMFAISNDTAQEVLAAPVNIHELLESLDDSNQALSLEKSWHGLHYILTGDPVLGDPPLNFLLVGGAEVGDEDIGYGPARIFDPTSVANIDNALSKFSETDLDARFDPAAMKVAQIYPNIWDENRVSLMGEYTGYLETLKAYVHRTAELGQALLITLR
jgi:Domain of unknown function (DUF1877)